MSQVPRNNQTELGRNLQRRYPTSWVVRHQWPGGNPVRSDRIQSIRWGWGKAQWRVNERLRAVLLAE